MQPSPRSVARHRHFTQTGTRPTSAVSTVIAVVLAVPVGLLFDGTPLPLVAGALVFAICAQLTMARLRRIEQPVEA